MSAVQYYLLTEDSLTKLFDALAKSFTVQYVTVSRVEGICSRLRTSTEQAWNPEKETFPPGTFDQSEGWRYAVRLTSDQIAALSVRDQYKDFLVNSRAVNPRIGEFNVHQGISTSTADYSFACSNKLVSSYIMTY